MKKSKLLTLISTLSITGITLPAISSCANSQQINTTSDNKTQTTNSTQNNTQSWTVTFDKGDGTSISGTTKFIVKDQRKFGSIDKSTITKPNYTQTGWKDTLTNSQVYDYTKITANMNIVPIFEQDPKYYTVSLFAGSGYFKDAQGNKTKIQQFNVLENTTIKEALGSLTIENDDADIEYDGNWTDGSETYDESKEITSNLTLTAKYESAWVPTLSETYKDAIGIKVKYSDSNSLKLLNYGSNAPALQMFKPTTALPVPTSDDDWTQIGGSSPTEVSLSTGDIVYLKSNQSSGWSTTGNNYSTINITAECNISGSVMGLLNNGGKDTSVSTTEIPCGYCFKKLFWGLKIKKVNASFLPATTLTQECYGKMFLACSSLTSIPSSLLPATTVKNFCYYEMFSYCTGLTSLPENLLPATTLDSYCYQEMFSYCINLATLPKSLLSSTNIAGGCYSHMFQNCTSLAEIPEELLHSTSLQLDCYDGMFENCTGLTSLPENLLPATTVQASCYSLMFEGCSSLESIPSNFLPATSLDVMCYSSMFYGCTSLQNVPTLPAPALVWCCYYQMFYNCTSIKINENGTGTKIFECPSTEGLTDPVTDMFTGTGGTFTGTPTAGNTYYWYTE